MSRGIMLVLIVTGTAVIFLCDGVHSRCTNTTKSRNTGGSCSFEYNYCGWSEVAGDEDLGWERLDLFHLGQNSYIQVNFDGASAGSVAHLYSPWLCATGSDAFRSLSFRYSIEESARCHLSVVMVTKTRRKEIWETSEGTGIPFSNPVPSIYLQCSREPFQIVFVGQKLTGEPCGKLYDEIGLDDVIYRDVFVTSTPHHDCVTLPVNVLTTPQPPISPPTDSTVTHPLTDEGDVNTAAVVGVLLVVFIVVAAIVAAYLVWRRRKKGKEQLRDQELQQKTRSMANYTYIDPDRFSPAGADSNPTADVTSPRDVRGADDDVADDAENAAVYSVPDDLYLHPNLTPDPGDRLTPPPGPQCSGPVSEARTPLSRDSSSAASRYNRLQHHGGDRHLEQGITGEHTYDRLAERDEGSSLYEPLGTEGRETRAACGSTMVSEYVDMNQARDQTPADPSLYENCD